jgi:hypothetical protein
MPFDETRKTKKTILNENQLKVARMKEEKRFIQCMRHDFKLSNLDVVRKQLLEEKQAALLDSTLPKSAPAADIKREVPMRRVASFQISVTSLEPTHGGASLWTGESDGSIGVRNGVTGALVYQIDAPPQANPALPPAVAETLFAVGSHMWAGFSDGSIRIFDQLVFILAFEAKLHVGAVTAFAQSFDGKTFSASADGTVAKWDTEVNNFENLHCIDGVEGCPAATCLAAYGYNLFVGYANGAFFAYDIETGDQTVKFEGHTDAITGVCSQDGFLFSVSCDATVAVWNIATGEMIKTLSAQNQARVPVTSIMCDKVGHSIWTSDAEGVINVWSSQHENNFCLIKSVAHDETAEIVSLKGIVAIDAVKVWSLGSNGENKVWHSSTNLVEEAIRDGLRAMRSIIEQDEVELRKWNELIRTLHEVAYRLRVSLASSLGVGADRRSQRGVYLLWKRWVLWSQMKKFQMRALQMQSNTAEISLMQRTFTSLLLNRQKKHRLRYKTQLGNLLLADSQRELILAYIKKMEFLRYRLRRLKRARSIANVNANYTDIISMRCAFNKLLSFRLRRQQERQRHRMTAMLEVSSQQRLMVLFFRQWQSRVQRKDVIAQKVFHAAALGSAVHRSLRLSYFATWKSFVEMKKRHRSIQRHVVLLSASSGEYLQAKCYGKWKRYAELHMKEALTKAYAERVPETMDLEGQLQAVQHLLRRRRLLDDASEAIRVALLARSEKLERIESLKQQNKDLADKIDAKRQGKVDAVTRSIQEQVADLIARLKCKFLNFNGDIGLIAKVVERSKRLSASKSFLEAHSAVKRVVVEMTKITYLDPDLEWPLSEAAIRKMKSHHTETVLGAIKTMIITYDIMTAQERCSLQTDHEIVVNARILQEIADFCILSKTKRLGGRR